MNDDWRLQIDFEEEGHGRALTDRLEAGRLQHDLSAAFHDRVIVTRDGARVLLYAGDREQAERAREMVAAEAAREGWKAEAELRHWHPAAEEWKDPEVPLPEGDATRLAEHEALMARERAEAERGGDPEWEVRVDLPSHGDALRLSERLREEGLAAVHRWRYVLVGAADEDAARALAERIEGEAPEGARVAAEGTWAEAYAERPPNPFAVLGGLGG